MTNSVIIPPIGAGLAAILFLVFVLACLAIKRCEKSSPKSVKSVRSSEPVKKGNVGKIVGIVILCLILIILVINVSVFVINLSPYESIGEIYQGFDQLVKDTKQKLINVDASNLPETSLDMFKNTRDDISIMNPLSDKVKTMNEYLEYQKENDKYLIIVNDQRPQLLTFETFINGLKQNAETKHCSLDVDWTSDVFKVFDRLLSIGQLVHKQSIAMDTFEQKLKTQMTKELVEEEKKVSKHLESTKGFIDYIKKHLQALTNIGAERGKKEIPSSERNIAIVVVSASTFLACLTCVFTIYAIIQLLRNQISSFILNTLTIFVYITTCQIVALCLLIVILCFAGYVGNQCVSPIDSDMYTMSSFADNSTIYSNVFFQSCSSSSDSLFSVFGQELLLSTDVEIDDLQKKIDVSVFSEDFDSIVVESNKVRELHEIMSNLVNEQKCFDEQNQQEIQKYRDMFKILVDGGDTYGNATIKFNALNLHKHISAAFFEKLKRPLGTANTPVNDKMKLSDFECDSISALHLKCAKMQCPKEYSYFDEALLHLMFVVLLSTVLHFILLRINKFKGDGIYEAPSKSSVNPSIQNVESVLTQKDQASKISSTSKQTNPKPSDEKISSKKKKNSSRRTPATQKGMREKKIKKEQTKNKEEKIITQQPTARTARSRDLSIERSQSTQDIPTSYLEFVPSSYNDHTMKHVKPFGDCCTRRQSRSRDSRK